MRINQINSYATLTLLLWKLSWPAQAQTTYVENIPQRGFLATSTKQLSEIDSVDMVNGSVAMRIPLAQLPPGPAGMGFGIDLVYNSNLYDVAIGTAFDPILGTYVYTQEPRVSPVGGWAYSFNSIQLLQDQRQPPPNTGWSCVPDDANARRLYRLRIGLPDGSLHTLHLKGFANVDGGASAGDGFYAHAPSGLRSFCATQFPGIYPKNLTGTLTYYTEDGSFIKVELEASGSGTEALAPVRVYLPDGSKLILEGVGSRSVTDANGNRIRLTNTCESNCTVFKQEITDDANRKVTVQYGNTSPRSDTISGLAPQGGTAPVWSVTWGGATAGSSTTEYECASGLFCPFWQTLSNAISSIGVPGTPNSLSYSFTYSTGTNKYGEIGTANLPYGARVEYDWRNSTRLLANLLDNPLTQRRLVHVAPRTLPAISSKTPKVPSPGRITE